MRRAINVCTNQPANVTGPAHQETPMTARYRRPYPRPGQGTPQHEQLHQLFQHAQTLVDDLEDYAHHHSDQARELSEVPPLLLGARDTLRAMWQRTVPLPS
jgi:hypothetical protein